MELLTTITTHIAQVGIELLDIVAMGILLYGSGKSVWMMIRHWPHVTLSLTRFMNIALIIMLCAEIIRLVLVRTPLELAIVAGMVALAFYMMLRKLGLCRPIYMSSSTLNLEFSFEHQIENFAEKVRVLVSEDMDWCTDHLMTRTYMKPAHPIYAFPRGSPGLSPRLKPWAPPRKIRAGNFTFICIYISKRVWE